MTRSRPPGSPTAPPGPPGPAPRCLLVFLAALLLVLLSRPCLGSGDWRPSFSADVDTSQYWLDLESPRIPLDRHRTNLRVLPRVSLRDEGEDPSPWDFHLSVQAFALDSLPPGRGGMDVDPYRYWARYGRGRIDLRLGLQKIVFGHAKYLRPLALFDRIDPTDFSRRTPGVKAARLRFFPRREQEVTSWWIHNQAEPSRPHLGGRLVRTVPGGEAALTYHRWQADGARVPETVLGLDAFADLTVGLWLEHATHLPDTGPERHRTTLGVDYTFPGVGNGLHVGLEYLRTQQQGQGPEERSTVIFLDTRLTLEDTLYLAFLQEAHLGLAGYNLRWIRDLGDRWNGELSFNWVAADLDELVARQPFLPFSRGMGIRFFYAF